MTGKNASHTRRLAPKYGVPGTPERVLPRGQARKAALLRITSEIGDQGSESFVRNHPACLAMDHDVSRAAIRCDYGRHTGGERLQHYVTEGVGV